MIVVQNIDLEEISAIAINRSDNAEFSIEEPAIQNFDEQIYSNFQSFKKVIERIEKNEKLEFSD